MAFHMHAALAALCVAFVASQAALPGEIYWNSKLPNTTMPRAISNVLLPGKGEEIVPDLRRSGYKRRHYTLENEKDGEVVPDLRRSGYKRRHYTLDNEKDAEVVPDLRRSGYKRRHYTLENEDAEVVPDLRRSGYKRRHYTLENEDAEVVPDLRRSGYKRRHYTLNTEEENGEVVPDLRRSGYKRRHYTLNTDDNSKDNTEENGEVVPDLRRSGYKRRHYTLNTDDNSEDNTEENGEVVPDLRRSGYKRRHYTLNAEENGEVVPDLRRSGYKRRHYTLASDKDDEAVPDLRRSGYKRRHYALSSDKDEVLVNPPSAPWFLEKDLVPGKQMEMEIARPENNGYTFIPRQAADSIPFSSNKLSAILTQLSIEPESPKAELIKDTLKECELPAEEGEVKTCATSLESMIDFSIQRLGKNIQAVSTEAEKDTKLQNFTILSGIKKIGNGEAVACHKQNYAYAVFYCHDVKGARTYVVPFVGTSGTKVTAVGICHTNTTAWSPEHEAFKILKVKPGGEPVCHFLPEYNVLLTRK
uniref:BURP domain-containing protein n=1 Tax=Kalanchoe fedtschenkoi TaxID=63787 RepID=A0A7N0RIA5_KALFE